MKREPVYGEFCDGNHARSFQEGKGGGAGLRGKMRAITGYEYNLIIIVFTMYSKGTFSIHTGQLNL